MKCEATIIGIVNHIVFDWMPEAIANANNAIKPNNVKTLNFFGERKTLLGSRI
ncbi:hypothetical protein MACH26_06810 [Planctobacterium marinum]|uniref:Uncharacterized protein n=1 Tax=Planctobacterium marinum TaxID=1631968 RepID=A0AA48I3C3_9ALTE|nr:hypothetical protein MACH26_06810 [Planctobacterium marinum]